jgi:hypothetical protein
MKTYESRCSLLQYQKLKSKKYDRDEKNYSTKTLKEEKSNY